MSTITELFASVWRNDSTLGDPDSGVHAPAKSEIRAVGAAIDTQKAEAVADLAAIKALTSRPLLVFVKALDQFYVWNAGSTATPDDETVIECTSGAAGRYLLWIVSNPSPVPVLSGHIDGLTYAKNGSNTIDIDAGVAVANDGETVISYAGDTALDLTTLFGDGGLLDTGTVANTTYDLYLVRNPGTEDVRPLAVVEGDEPVWPSGYTQYRKFGWLYRTAGALPGFKTYLTAGGGLEFAWTGIATDVTATIGTSRSLVNLVRVPQEMSVVATIGVDSSINGTALNICCPDQSDTAPAFSGGIGTFGLSAAMSSGSQVIAFAILKAQQRVRTNASGQVAMRATSAGNNVYASVISFEMSRR